VEIEDRASRVSTVRSRVGDVHRTVRICIANPETTSITTKAASASNTPSTPAVANM